MYTCRTHGADLKIYNNAAADEFALFSMCLRRRIQIK